MNLLRKDEGFTLVELMVVVLIIGILVAIAVPIFNAAKGSAQQKTCFANQRTIEGAVQSYQASNGALPPTVAAGGTAGDGSALITGGYVKSWPYCPALASGAATNTLSYGIDAGGSVTLASGDPHSHY
jgi:prepilin-type N-terminal cleavage/methylation domain-containing protein